MLPRVNPIMLLGLIVVLVLSVAILASARAGGGSPGDALAAATGQVGAPYGFGTDGGGSFSCTGLVRHALRSAGVDPNAPWDHMAYLSVYPTVSEPAPGDVVVYPDGVAMYVGDGQIVMANEVDQVVGYYGMNEVGTPVGFARPYGGASDMAAEPTVGDPAAANPAGAAQYSAEQAIPIDPMAIDPTIPVDPAFVDPALVDPAFVDPLAAELIVEDPMVADPALADPMVADPALVDPALVDPLVY